MKEKETTIYEKIIEAQKANQSEITFIEDGKEVKITLKPTKWIEGMLKY